MLFVNINFSWCFFCFVFWGVFLFSLWFNFLCFYFIHLFWGGWGGFVVFWGGGLPFFFIFVFCFWGLCFLFFFFLVFFNVLDFF